MPVAPLSEVHTPVVRCHPCSGSESPSPSPCVASLPPYSTARGHKTCDYQSGKGKWRFAARLYVYLITCSWVYMLGIIRHQ